MAIRGWRRGAVGATALVTVCGLCVRPGLAQERAETIFRDARDYTVRIRTQITTPFVQDEIRAEIMERRFNKLSMEYVLKLAGNATISSLDAFVSAAVQRADKLTAVAAGRSPMCYS